MSTEAIGAAAPEATIVMDVKRPDDPGTSKPTGLHSPPDSNNAMNLDGSDSELSDIEEVAHKLNGTLDDIVGEPVKEEPAPEPAPEPKQEEEEEEDIGEILPDEWSGTVPVFRPTMKQFRDFKKFVSLVPSLVTVRTLLTG